MIHAKRCRYCRTEFKSGHPPTVDHVIPRWVLRLFNAQFVVGKSEFHVRNRVTACHSCNRRKGCMPVVTFLAIRLEGSHVVKAERSRWDRISNTLNALNRSALAVHPLAELVIGEFSRPIPEHFVTGDKAIGIGPPAPAQMDWVTGK